VPRLAACEQKTETTTEPAAASPTATAFGNNNHNDNHEPRGNDFAGADSLTTAKVVQKFALSV
jgi:hypothetical protein